MDDAGSTLTPKKAGFTRHEFIISSDITQNFMLEANLNDIRTTPKQCVLTPMAIQTMFTYVELYKPSATTPFINTSFTMMGAYALNGGVPLVINAGESYKFAIELWGTNTYVPRDFSVVTWG